MSADMFFTSPSVYDENGVGVLKPRLEQDGTFGSKKVFDNILNKDALNEEYMMLNYVSCGNASLSDARLIFSPTLVYFECENFAKTSKGVKNLEDKIYAALGDTFASIVRVTDVFNRFNQVYLAVSISTALCIVVGAVSTS